MLKALFGVLLLALLLSRLDMHAIWAAFTGYNWLWMMAALGILALSWALAAVRWAVFVPTLPFSRLLELTLISQFYAIVLPGQLAGELVKAYRVAKGSADAECLAASVALDRVLGTIALLLVACTGMLLSHRQLPNSLVWLSVAWALGLIAMLFSLRLTWISTRAIALANRLESTRLRRIAVSMHRLIDAWRDFAHVPARLLVSLMLGISFQLLGVAIFALMGMNLGINLSLADWAWIVGITSIAILLPVSIGGIGLREGALVGCLGFLGIAAERAIALSLVIFVLTLFGAFVGGVIEFREAVRRRPPGQRSGRCT